ncbi:hypothetical protein ENSA5_52150 [Enhygromyxa salina]|uniref:Uncharacterized protein n=1 Tax=Enhygromyxa salina TaxID=215803 RepID=A0A2S9XGQ2_9BACT|nr:hypothetical protein ENSA5_52150 [Enhygromyxa salina]
MARVDLRQPRDLLLNRRQDLDPLDRVDPELRLHVHRQLQHLLRVAGLVRDHRQHQRLEIHPRRGRGRGLGDRRRGCCRDRSGLGRRDGRGRGDRLRYGHGRRDLHGCRCRCRRVVLHGRRRHDRLRGDLRRDARRDRQRNPSHRGEAREAGLGHAQERGVRARHRLLNHGVGLRRLTLSLLPGCEPGVAHGRSRGLDRCARAHRRSGRSRGPRRRGRGRRRRRGRRSWRGRRSRRGRRSWRGDRRGRGRGDRGGTRGRAWLVHRCLRRGGHGPRRIGTREVLGPAHGRIGLLRVGPAQGHGQLGLGPRVRIGGRQVAIPQHLEAQRNTQGAQSRQRPRQRGHAPDPAPVEGDRRVLAPVEDLADEVGQDRARTDLHECMHARVGHGLDDRGEAHGLGDLPPEPRAHGRGLGLVGGPGLAGVDRQLRGLEAQLVEEAGEGFGARGHQRRVKGRRDRQPLDPEPRALERLLGDLDRLDGPADDRLLGRVEVGEHDVVDALERRADFVGRGRDRAHRPRAVGLSRGGHQLAAAPRDPEHVGLAEHAASVEGHDLAEAVPGHRLGLDAELAQHREQRRARAADRGLSPLGLAQLDLVGRPRLVVEAGDREHDAVEGQAVAERGIGGAVPGPAGDLVAHGQLRGHADVLAALAREQQPDPADLGPEPVGGPVGALERGLGRRLDLLGRALELGPQLVLVARDEREPGRGARVELTLAVPRREAQEPALVAAPRPRSRLAGELGSARATEDHELDRERAQPLGPGPGARVLLEQEVKVGPAEAKRAHARAPRVLGPADPRPRLGVEVKGRVVDLERGVGPLDLDRGRQDLVVQRHHGLEQPGGPSRGLGVADLRLDRAQRAPLRALAGPKGLLQALKLGRVAGLGPGPVGLDQFDGPRLDPGVVPGPAQGLGLARRHRRVDALRAPVRGRADPAQDRVDPVAVALGVVEALERDHAQALAEHRPVGLIGEGSAVPRGRQRRRLGEAHEHEDVVERVDAPGDDHVGVAEVELLRGHAQRREGRGAGRIGHAVGPAEVEAVGDPPGDDVAEQAGERALLPRRVVIGDPIADRLDLVLAEALLAQRLDPNRLLQPADHRREQLLGRGHPEDDRDPRAIHRLELAPGRVAQDLLGDDQPEQLRGVGRLDDVRRHAPGQRVEVDLRQEAPALGVGLVGRPRIGVVVVLGQPVGRRDLGQQIGASEDVGPKPGRVARAGEQGGGADDGERGAGLRCHEN